MAGPPRNLRFFHARPARTTRLQPGHGDGFSGHGEGPRLGGVAPDETRGVHEDRPGLPAGLGRSGPRRRRVRARAVDGRDGRRSQAPFLVLQGLPVLLPPLGSNGAFRTSSIFDPTPSFHAHPPSTLRFDPPRSNTPNQHFEGVAESTPHPAWPPP